MTKAELMTISLSSAPSPGFLALLKTNEQTNFTAIPPQNSYQIENSNIYLENASNTSPSHVQTPHQRQPYALLATSGEER